jgi:hypothetical protein
MPRRGFDNIKPTGNRSDNLKPEELWDIFKFSDHEGDWIDMRFLDQDFLPVKMHWIKILVGKDDQPKREVKIPKLCVSFNPDDESTPLDGTDCPYCKLPQGRESTCQTSKAYYANVIIRDLQENEPRKKKPPTKTEKKTGIKELKSESWTPVRVVRMPAGLAKSLQELGERNTHGKGSKKRAYSIQDAKYGIDVAIKYDSKGTGTDKYKVDKGSHAPLEDDELEYLYYDLGDDSYELLGRESQEAAEKEFKRMDFVGGADIDDEEDEDDIPSSRKKKGDKKKSKRSRIDDDEDEDEDEDEEDEDESPRSRRSKKSKRSRRSSIDDDDEDEEDEDEDEDDSPRRSKRGKRDSSRSSSRKSRRSSIDDDEDEDDDEDDAPRRSKKRSSKSSSSSKRSGKTRRRRG